MAQGSAIEWTDATWNPVTGCTRVSPGCAHCYIETTIPLRTQHRRFVRKGDEETTGLILHDDRIDARRVPKGPRVFVNSLSDLFHEDIPHEFVWRVFDLMRLLPDRQFQVLTKRPERMREIVERYYKLTARGIGTPDVVEYPLPNVWLGVSIENARYTWRADVLREIPAAVRFISAEPLLGSLFPETITCPRCEGQRYDRGSCSFCVNRGRLDANGSLDRMPLDLTSIDWLIVGGESGGRDARPMHPEWARELRDACLDESVGKTGIVGYDYATRPAFFFKQWGSWGVGSYQDRPRLYVSSDGFATENPWQDERLAEDRRRDGKTERWRSLATMHYAGASPKSGGRELDGRTWDEMP